MKPVAIDLCCGLGGWTAGLISEGWDVIGFDIERHEYGDKRYPADLILKSILEINGYDLRAVKPAIVVASPPCQRYSWMAMPFSRGKREASWQRWERDSPFGNYHLNDLFDACFRIAREIGCPIVLENVKGAQPWVGRANAHFGSYYLWGDVGNVGGRVVRADRSPRFGEYVGTTARVNGCKVEGINFSGYGEPGYKAQGFNVTAAQRLRSLEADRATTEGMKGTGGGWFEKPYRERGDITGQFNSKSDSRKAASAMIAEIPFPLAQYIARVFKPR
jgi:hypothetical protein